MVNWEMKINLINSKNSPKFSHVLFGALNNFLLLIKLVVNLPLRTYFKPVLISLIVIFAVRFLYNIALRGPKHGKNIEISLICQKRNYSKK